MSDGGNGVTSRGNAISVILLAKDRMLAKGIVADHQLIGRIVQDFAAMQQRIPESEVRGSRDKSSGGDWKAYMLTNRYKRISFLLRIAENRNGSSGIRVCSV